MKTFLEMIDLMKGRPQRGRLGHELNCVDYIQLGNGHWAGHNRPGNVFVSVDKYPKGSYPERFKYEEGRPATEEEYEEYWAAWNANRNADPRDKSPWFWNYDES